MLMGRYIHEIVSSFWHQLEVRSMNLHTERSKLSTFCIGWHAPIKIFSCSTSLLTERGLKLIGPGIRKTYSCQDLEAEFIWEVRPVLCYLMKRRITFETSQISSIVTWSVEKMNSRALSSCSRICSIDALVSLQVLMLICLNISMLVQSTRTWKINGLRSTQ